MEHLVYYDIAAAFVLLTALAAYHLRKYSDNFQSRVYRVMLYALLVVSTSDFLLFWEEITFGKTGTIVLLYICILGQVVAAAAYLLYILCLTGRVERFIRKGKGWLFVPAWIVIALLVVQLFIPSGNGWQLSETEWNYVILPLYDLFLSDGGSVSGSFPEKAQL